MITLLRWQVIQCDKRGDLILERSVRPLRLCRCLLSICSGLARLVAVTRRLLRSWHLSFSPHAHTTLAPRFKLTLELAPMASRRWALT